MMIKAGYELTVGKWKDVSSSRRIGERAIKSGLFTPLSWRMDVSCSSQEMGYVVGLLYIGSKNVGLLGTPDDTYLSYTLMTKVRVVQFLEGVAEACLTYAIYQSEPLKTSLSPL